MKEKIVPPIAPVLMESTRAIGYRLEVAIADIIDNSIAASASKVDLYFFPEDAYVCILDDGFGMSDNQMDSAMQYGSKNPNEKRDLSDLGRYGLGLKTSSLSQCRVLTVISKQGKNIAGRRWDLDFVAKTGNWSLLVLDEKDMASLPHIEDLKQKQSGTLVVWQKLDRLLMGEVDRRDEFSFNMNEVRKHLELVFHRYLTGEPGIKKLTISFNNVEINAADPFLLKKTDYKTTPIMAPENIKVRDKQVTISPYILPHTKNMNATDLEMAGRGEGLRKNQGFYVYRNKRLLVWGTWFRMMRQGELTKLARVMVDIPNDLDDLWTLDIKKSQAIPPIEVKQNLKSVIEKVAEKSKRPFTVRGKKEISDAVEHVWNRLKTSDGGIRYEINRLHPLVENIVSANPDIKRKLETLLKFIEKGLQLNQMYIDLTSDSKIENESNVGEEEVRQACEKLLSTMSGRKAKLELLKRFSYVEPFCLFPQVIEYFNAKENL